MARGTEDGDRRRAGARSCLADIPIGREDDVLVVMGT
jgi:hypothetical protein